MNKKKSATWIDVKARLDQMDRPGLIGVVRDLYEASDLNRRFLHVRFAPTTVGLEKYRRLVRDAVFPNPFSQRPIRLREATAIVTEYKRATGDLAGAVDLMLEFVEAGTEQAADLGYGSDSYFAALERKVNDIVRALDSLSEADRRAATDRLAKLGEYQGVIGWGYCDFLADIAVKVQNRNGGSIRKRHRRHGV